MGTADQPLAEQPAMIRQNMLNHLQDRAVRGDIDDWRSLVDETLTYDENVQIIMREGGRRLPTEERHHRREQQAAARSRQHRHARDAVVERCMEISDEHDSSVFDAVLLDLPAPPGVNEQRYQNARQTVRDVEREFGAEFVAEARQECRERHGGEIPADRFRESPTVEQPAERTSVPAGMVDTALTPEEAFGAPEQPYAEVETAPEEQEFITEDLRDQEQVAEPETATTAFSDALFGFREVQFEREVPTGRFVADAAEDPRVPNADRSWSNGRFVSPERVPVDEIVRAETTGRYWEREDAERRSERMEARTPEEQFRDVMGF